MIQGDKERLRFYRKESNKKEISKDKEILIESSIIQTKVHKTNTGLCKK